MKITLLICFIFYSLSAFTFDGNRNGFQASLGAGVSNISAKFSGDREMDATLSAYAFRMGWGLGERFAVFLGKESHLYKYAGEDILNEISCLGGKLYLLQDFYLYGGSGIGGFMNEITLDSSKATLGTGSYYGVGYEIVKHFSVEAGISKMVVDQDDLNDDNIVAPYEQTSTNILFMVQLY